MGLEEIEGNDSSLNVSSNLRGNLSLSLSKIGALSLVGVLVCYMSLYGLGVWVSHYELGIVTGQADELIKSWSSGPKKFRSGEIAEIQNKKHALKPIFWKPKSIILSLLGERIYSEQTIELMPESECYLILTKQ